MKMLGDNEYLMSYTKGFSELPSPAQVITSTLHAYSRLLCQLNLSRGFASYGDDCASNITVAVSHCECAR